MAALFTPKQNWVCDHGEGAVGNLSYLNAEHQALFLNGGGESTAGRLQPWHHISYLISSLARSHPISLSHKPLSTHPALHFSNLGRLIDIGDNDYLKCGHIKISSMNTGFDEMASLVNDFHFEVFGVYETWLLPGIPSDNLKIFRYVMLHSDRILIEGATQKWGWAKD
ncbi:hypothetical protein J6590_030543 [Homalodisca vitripennis]|nr:hypothetical protein J6590_030543 [Homalodisca vitripennis]